MIDNCLLKLLLYNRTHRDTHVRSCRQSVTQWRT